MKKYITFLMIILVIALFGCTAPEEEGPLPGEELPVIGQQKLPEEVVVEPKQPEGVDDVTDMEDKITDEKQLSLGATDITEEEATIISYVNCTFEDKLPKGFSFKINNIEETEWVFSALSYSERERFRNPIVQVNGLQVTNSQLIKACGESRLKPGKGVHCEFNLEDVSHTVLRKSLKTGISISNELQKNKMNIRTGKTAAEIGFVCE